MEIYLELIPMQMAHSSISVSLDFQDERSYNKCSHKLTFNLMYQPLTIIGLSTAIL
jgi:hypothetical protein